jgi:hypothetical protein
MKKLILILSALLIGSGVGAQSTATSEAKKVSIGYKKSENTSVPEKQIEKASELDISRPVVESINVDEGIPISSKWYSNRFALVIGNESYTSSQVDLNAEVNVEHAVNDAETFANYFHLTFGVPENQVILLTNAGFIEMQKAIKKLQLLIKNTNGAAEVFVYYAGHGFPDEMTREPFLIPVDVSATELEYAIGLKELYATLTEFPSQLVTVFLDACFSGGARNQPLLAARGVRVKPKEQVLSGNLIVFSASQSTQSALGSLSQDHGLFTYHLLEKIKATKGKVTYGELFDFTQSKVSVNSVLEYNKEQNPTVLVSPELMHKWTELKFIK